MPAYISEVAYEGPRSTDFVEVRVASGTDMSSYSLLVYDQSGSVTFTNTFGTADATMAGSDIYVIDDTDPGGMDLRDNRAVALIDDLGNVLQFLSFASNTVTAVDGAANGQTSTDIGTSSTDGSLQSDNGGSSYYDQVTPNAGTVPCYAPGTMIETPTGSRRVEDLRVGAFVETVDNGAQRILWISRRKVVLTPQDTGPGAVLITAEALGRGLPVRALTVSPQHRILVGAADQLQDFFAEECLVAAKSLIGLPGISRVTEHRVIRWVHFALARHEVVRANAALSESLLLGPTIMAGFTRQQRRDLRGIFGTPKDVRTPLNGPVARACLTVGEAQRMIRRSGRRSDAKRSGACRRDPVTV